MKVAIVKAWPREPFGPIHINHNGLRRNAAAIPANKANSQEGLVSRTALAQIRNGRQANASSVMATSSTKLSAISPDVVANQALPANGDAELLKDISAAKQKRFAPSKLPRTGQAKYWPLNLECPSPRKTANAATQINSSALGTCWMCRIKAAAALSRIKPPANRYNRPST